MKLECRAWHKEDKEMIEFDENFFSDMSAVTGYGEGVKYDVVDLMLCSQLYDDNSIKIYDGDIVRIQDKNETKTSYISVVGVTPYFGALVTSHPAHVALGVGKSRYLYDYCSVGISEETSCTCEVIGNIYLNPELIPQ